jgi:hypothetical protein
MTRRALGVAIALAVIGSVIFVFGALQQSFCNPSGSGCTRINYTPIYVGIAILVASAGVAIASSRSKPHTTNLESTLQRAVVA